MIYNVHKFTMFASFSVILCNGHVIGTTLNFRAQDQHFKEPRNRWSGGIDSLESITGLLERLQIRALVLFNLKPRYCRRLKGLSWSTLNRSFLHTVYVHVLPHEGFFSKFTIIFRHLQWSKIFFWVQLSHKRLSLHCIEQSSDQDPYYTPFRAHF